MPKTTTTGPGADIADRIRVERERILADWERSEEQAREQRANVLAQRKVFYELEQERTADISFWEKDLARPGIGCRPVVAAWPDCPVPPVASATHAPTADMPILKAPRPVIYDAGTYRLDEQGIWLRRANYWISSPTFQVARGFDGDRPSLYAVEVNGKWRTVEVDPRRDTSAVMNALTGAGLRLNPQPVHHDALLNAVPATRYRDHFIVEAWEKLVAFLDDHHRELPVRS